MPLFSNLEDAKESTHTDQSPSIVVFLPDGSLNTTATRIDFSREDWYQQFLEIRDALSTIRNLNEENLTRWWSQQNGFSEIIPFKDYALLTNACTTYPFASVKLFEKTQGDVTSKAKPFNKGNDFYCR